MGLKVWLPLNKDLRNIGFDNISITNHGVGTVNDGMFNSVEFNGTSNYFQFNNLNIDSLRYLSLAFWVYQYRGGLIGVFTVRGSGNAHQISLTDQGVRFRDINHSTLTTVPFEQPSANVWTHYVIIYSDGTWIIYKDGVKIQEQVYASGTLNSSLNEIRIGLCQSSSSNEYFTGKICDFRIYDIPLSEEDAKRIYRKKRFDLVPYTNELKSVLFDASGFVEMPLIIGLGVKFKDLGYGLVFTGGTLDRLRPKAGNVGFGMLSGGTVSLWFSTKTQPTSQKLMYIDSTSKMGIGFNANTGSCILLCSQGSSKAGYQVTGFSFADLYDNTIVSYSKTNRLPSAAIINGIVPAAGGSSTYWSESNGLTIGGRTSNNNNNFVGDIYRVVVYENEFSSANLLELYNNEKNSMAQNLLPIGTVLAKSAYMKDTKQLCETRIRTNTFEDSIEFECYFTYGKNEIPRNRVNVFGNLLICFGFNDSGIYINKGQTLAQIQPNTKNYIKIKIHGALLDYIFRNKNVTMGSKQRFVYPEETPKENVCLYSSSFDSLDIYNQYISIEKFKCSIDGKLVCDLMPILIDNDGTVKWFDKIEYNFLDNGIEFSEKMIKV